MPNSRTPEQVVPAAVAPDHLRIPDHGEVRAGEIGRAADELGQGRRERLEHNLGGLPRCHRLGLRIELLHERVHARRKIGREFARRAAAQFSGFGRKRLLVPREEPLPAPLRARAALARVKALVHMRGNFERRVPPADRFARGGDFLFTERRAMRRAGISLGGRPFRDHGLRADQRRARLLPLRLAQRAVHCRDLMTVDVRDHLPAVGLEAAPDVVGVPLADVSLLGIDRDAVVVVDRDQLAEPERAGERAGFVREALHHAAVAHENVGMVVDDVTAGPVEFRGEQFLGERHADRVRDALAERPGGGFDTGRAAVLRMPRCLRMQLAEAFQLRQRQVVAGQVQQRVEQHRAVAVREHEAVAVDPGGIGRVVPQVAVPQHFRDLRHAHRHAGMAGIRLLYGIHRQRADRVGHLDTNVHSGVPCAGGGKCANYNWRRRPPNGHLEATRDNASAA